MTPDARPVAGEPGFPATGRTRSKKIEKLRSAGRGNPQRRFEPAGAQNQREAGPYPVTRAARVVVGCVWDAPEPC